MRLQLGRPLRSSVMTANEVQDEVRIASIERLPEARNEACTWFVMAFCRKDFD